MQIFLTGATGFIGSHFVSQAHDAGHEVIALKYKPESKPRIPLSKDPKWLNKSLEDVLPSDLEGIDVIVHLAAHSANVPYDTLLQCMHWNVIVPLTFLEKAREAGIQNYVIAGSCFEYGRSGVRYEFIPADAPLEPTQTYPASKAAASIAFLQWAQMHKMSLSIQRIFQVYGPGEAETRLWPSICNAANKSEDFPMTNGDQIRDFIHVQAVASQLISECERIIGQSQPTIQIANLGSGNPQTLYSFCFQIWNETAAKGRIVRGALPYREGEIMRYVPDLTPVIWSLS